MRHLFFKNTSALRTAMAGIALVALLAGCPEPDSSVIEWMSNELTVQMTVQNNSSAKKLVTLLPAFGQRKDTAYQWTVSPEAGFRVDDPVNLAANTNRILAVDIGESAYDGFEVGDMILSFLLQIGEDEYTGWDTAQYGNSGKTLEGQGYGYVVLFGDDWNPGWHSSRQPQSETANTEGITEWVTARYTVTITDDDVAFVLDEVVFGREADFYNYLFQAASVVKN
jgi:hypothetical protein